MPVENYFSSDFKLGILGGGQLGRMLLAETQKLDIYTLVLDSSREAPCTTICDEFHLGDLLDFDTVYNFGKNVNVLTIEIENVNVDALEKLDSEGVTVLPSPKSLRIIQDKSRQKLFYIDNNIPTADFARFTSIEELKHSYKNNAISSPFIWKSSKFGYDGRGVKIVKTVTDLEGLPNIDCIAENIVPFKKELAVILARNRDGQTKTYPVVEMEFNPQTNQVEYVICPARISQTIAKKAEETALKVADSLNFVGLLAVELFQTQEDEILVNEVAPRPHNSGHFSIEGSYTNQFEQHLRSILNLPLGNTENKVESVMVNLVGEAGFSGDVFYQNMTEVLKIAGVTPHIYGKKQTKPFRKMGHITIVHKNIDVAREIAERVKSIVKVISK